MFEFEFNHFGYLKHLDKSSKFIACTHFRGEVAKKDPNWPKAVKARKKLAHFIGCSSSFCAVFEAQFGHESRWRKAERR